MDGQRFDDLARRLALRATRRSVLRGLIGTAAAAALASIGRADAHVDSTAAVAVDMDQMLVGTTAPAPIAAGKPRRARAPRATATPTARPAVKGRSGATVRATPGLTLCPTSAKPGTSIRATLSGFGQRERITLTWYDGSTKRTLAVGSASTSGRLSLSFEVPRTFGGSHRVRAEGTSGAREDARLTVLPSVRLSPASATAGANVTFTLRGFAAGHRVDLRFFPGLDAGETPARLSSVTVSASGSAVYAHAIPGNAVPGRHRVEARQRSDGVTAATRFTVLCEDTSDCTAAPCQVASCDAGTCRSTALPDGRGCAADGALGICVGGTCSAKPDLSTVACAGCGPCHDCAPSSSGWTCDACSPTCAGDAACDHANADYPFRRLADHLAGSGYQRAGDAETTLTEDGIGPDELLVVPWTDGGTGVALLGYGYDRARGLGIAAAIVGADGTASALLAVDGSGAVVFSPVPASSGVAPVAAAEDGGPECGLIYSCSDAVAEKYIAVIASCKEGGDHDDGSAYYTLSCTLVYQWQAYQERKEKCTRHCAPGQLCCDEICVDPTDVRNCGSCGQKCGVCEECRNGTCAPLDCGGPCLQCVDGACEPKDGCCDPPCGSCDDCQGNVCVPNGKSRCGDTCCDQVQECCGGACVAPCPGGNTRDPQTCQCGCVNPASVDAAEAGLCCPEGQTACGETCCPAGMFCDGTTCGDCGTCGVCDPSIAPRCDAGGRLLACCYGTCTELGQGDSCASCNDGCASRGGVCLGQQTSSPYCCPTWVGFHLCGDRCCEPSEECLDGWCGHRENYCPSQPGVPFCFGGDACTPTGCCPSEWVCPGGGDPPTCCAP